MIDFDHALRSAWERMVIMLFRPFNFGRWCAIGFGAFLASLVGGGGGFQYRAPNTDSFTKVFSSNHSSYSTLHQYRFNHAVQVLPHSLFTGIFLAIFIPVFIALVLLLFWLGARGQFIFNYNLIGNRAEISTPWRLFARPANQAFGVFLGIFFFLIVLVAAPAAAIAFLMISHHLIPTGTNAWHPNFVLFSPLYLELGVIFGFTTIFYFIVFTVHFLFRSFGIPLMLRYAYGPFTALRLSLQLGVRHWCSILALLATKLALLIVVLVLMYVICCATCCLGVLPYISTVLLLPFYVFDQNLTLCVMAQFGPAYDLYEPPATAPEVLPSVV